MSLINLHKKVLAERAKILRNLEDEWAMEELAEKLEGTHLSRKNIGSKLNNLHRNVSRRSRSRSRSRNRGSRTTRKAPRKRVNPEFARLGIPVPPSQRIGEERVRIGEKGKKD